MVEALRVKGGAKELRGDDGQLAPRPGAVPAKRFDGLRYIDHAPDADHVETCGLSSQSFNPVIG